MSFVLSILVAAVATLVLAAVLSKLLFGSCREGYLILVHFIRPLDIDTHPFGPEESSRSDAAQWWYFVAVAAIAVMAFGAAFRWSHD